MRVLFFGMTGRFSVPPLQELISAGVEIAAVVVPGSDPQPRRLEPPPPVPSDLPLANPYLTPTILHLAWTHSIPVWAVGRFSGDAATGWLAGFNPHLAVVACFPYRFPSAFLKLPRFGCLNLHPSLLPAYRGPTPLFWMARHGEPQAGVTLHFLDEGLDTGDIVAQTAFAWPQGISGPALEERCARAGAGLLLKAVRQLARGNPLPQRAQPDAGSSYYPFPSAPDFIIPTHWPARRAFNFLRAAADWPLVVEVEGVQIPIRIAIDYHPTQTLGRPYLARGNEYRIQFRPGVLHGRV